MQRIDSANITLRGELRARIIKNFARLQDRPYLPGHVGLSPYMSVGWDGDWEGRTILALALEEEALGTESAFLDDIVQWVRSICNSAGYRGELLDMRRINEQQLAAHSWLMRGLIAYQRGRNAEWVREWINQMLDRLYLPVAEHLIHYPQTPEDRKQRDFDAQAGKITDHFNEWILSSDIGCLFISIDGLTEAYAYTGRADVRALVEAMIRIFVRQDYAGTPLQTHACLTGMRGVMRAYRQTGRAEYLKSVQDFMEIYKRHGMTEFFANFDWFSTPLWTEPCGVIDSWMLAVQLWEATKNQDYLNFAQLIWYNGLMRGQRPNGGFGCDSCGEDGWLRPMVDFYEAYWCCTMRGGEGLTEPMRSAFYTDGDAVVIAHYADADIRLPDGRTLRLRAHLPESGVITIQCDVPAAVHLKLFIPDYAVNPEIALGDDALAVDVRAGFADVQADFSHGDTMRLTFDLKLDLYPTCGAIHEGAKRYTLRAGAMVLATEKGTTQPIQIADVRRLSTGEYEVQNCKFVPLHSAWRMDTEVLKRTQYQILFGNSNEP